MSILDGFDDIRTQADIAPQAMAYPAVIVTAPATADDEAEVTVDSFDDGVHKYPAKWMVRIGEEGSPIMPSVGDVCLVQFDSDGDAWIVVWWSSDNVGVAPPTGVTDHGALTGLSDDDHPQYHNDTRGDARYWQLSTDLATQAELDAHKSSSDHDGRYYTETEADALLAAKAPLASPALTGTPTAPTATGGTNTTQIATTAFVQAALGSYITSVAAAATYLPLTGGTLTGNLTVDHASSTSQLFINALAAQESCLKLRSGGSTIWSLSRQPTTDNFWLYNQSFGARAFEISKTTNVVDFNETPTKDGSAIWHAGNDGPGSGLDADTLDGVQLSALLQLAGGTMTGGLIIDESSGNSELTLDANGTNEAVINFTDDGAAGFKFEFDATNALFSLIRNATTVFSANESTGVVDFNERPTHDGTSLLGRVKIGSITNPGSTGNQATTGVGFTPRIVIFLTNGGDTTSTASFHVGAMTADGTQFSYATRVESGGRASQSSNSLCCRTIDTAGASIRAASFVSMDADGFTINWTTASAAGTTYYIAIG